jgi:transposase-like protein
MRGGKRVVSIEHEPGIASAYLAGASPSKMAVEYKTTVTTIKNVLKRHNVYPRPIKIVVPPKSGTPEFDELIVRMRQSGRRVCDIARQVQAATQTVSAVLQRADILPKWRRGENYKVTPDQMADIVRLYLAGESTSKLGSQFGCNARTIANVLKRKGVELRPRGAESAFANNESAVAEAVRLHKEGWSQVRIGRQLGVSQIVVSRLLLAHGYARFPHAAGERHGHWKGGRTLTEGGYVLVCVSPDHPMASMRLKNGYILEHRLVMAEHLGRPLTRTETVHHIDGVHGHNTIENLQLRQGRHGKHVRFQCSDCGSSNVLPVPL